MKFRLTALIAVAAVVALPAIASAATMSDSDIDSGRATVTSFPPVIVPPHRAATQTLFKAEDAYLAKACPAVTQHPGSYSAVLNRFCREYRG